jgi:hypothetical protein
MIYEMAWVGNNEQSPVFEKESRFGGFERQMGQTRWQGYFAGRNFKAASVREWTWSLW